MKDLTIVFRKVTSISIHQLSSHKIYKRCHMTLVQVAEHNPPIKNKRGTITLFSCHGLHPRLEAIKLLVSLTYPLKITKRQTIPHPDTSHNLHLIDIRHGIRLSECYGCCGCRWHLKLKHLNLLLKGGDHRCPLLNLEVLLLIGMLEVYDHVGTLVYHHTSGVYELSV
jgi:hypothetical protein